MSPHIYMEYNQMARTKQTARVTVAGKGCYKQLVAQKIARKQAPFKASTKAVQADDDQPIGFSQFSLKFDDQKECEKNAVKSDIIRCSSCSAVFTTQSKSVNKQEYEALKKQEVTEGGSLDEINARYLSTDNPIWICEFCCQHNPLPLKYSPPKEANPCFLLNKAKPSKKSNSKLQEPESEEQLLVFCIDVSPSMGNAVTTKSSRLDCVREAVRDEINRMKMERSTKIVGLMCFGSEVVIFDHKGKTTRMDQTLFEDFDKTANEAGKFPTKMWKSINKSHQALDNVLNKLPTSCGTAIGPALVIAVEIASNGSTGSRVIICTDGEANVGIGSHGKDDPFYSQIGEYAKAKGVSVSVLGVKGVDINLKSLGKVTHATGGTVMKVDPVKIGTEFSKIINEVILGSNAEVTVRLNKRFILKNVDKSLLSEKNTVLKQDLGNFSTDTELAFEFQTLTLEQASDQFHISLDIFRSQRLPMQVELKYRGLDGNQYLQIVTDWRQLIDDDKGATEGVDFGIFVINALQKVSKFISEENFERAGIFYKQVEEALKKSNPKTKAEKEQAGKHRQRLLVLRNILNRRSKKRNIRVFKDQSESEAEEDNEEDDGDSDDHTRRKSRSRSRGARKVKSTKSPKISKSKRVPKSRKPAENMSSSEEEAILYTEMRAK